MLQGLAHFKKLSKQKNAAIKRSVDFTIAETPCPEALIGLHRKAIFPKFFWRILILCVAFSSAFLTSNGQTENNQTGFDVQPFIDAGSIDGALMFKESAKNFLRGKPQSFDLLNYLRGYEYSCSGVHLRPGYVQCGKRVNYPEGYRTIVQLRFDPRNSLDTVEAQIINLGRGRD